MGTFVATHLAATEPNAVRSLALFGPLLAPPEPASQQPSPEDRLMSSERAKQITSAVEQLPDRQRLVFTLCHISEHTTSEISQALGLSEATVRVHLFRAVRKLRKLLERPRVASVSTLQAAVAPGRSSP